MKSAEGKTEFVEWACAIEPLSGEVDSGDSSVVQEFEGGMLLAVIDGIGHGKEAAKASIIAEEILKLHAGDSVISLVQLVHERLRSTRGVVLTLASLDFRDRTLTWIAVGNVAASIHTKTADGHRSSESVMMRGGMVGVQLPPLKAEMLPLTSGDLMIFATDGVYGGVSVGMKLDDPVSDICANTLKAYSKGIDDALVLVARYL